jgi:thymidine kinase
MQKNKLVNNLELIIGPVCSGKSAELIRRVDRYTIAGYNVLIIKPKVDTRSKYVESRNGNKLNCFTLERASDIYDTIVDLSLNKEINTDIIAFDEAQFFEDLYPIAKDLIKQEYKVLISALDSDFNGDPFGDIPKLVTLSDTLIRTTGVCMRCRSDNAIFSQKLKQGGVRIEIGNLELYQPRCINCFVPGGLTEGQEEE